MGGPLRVDTIYSLGMGPPNAGRWRNVENRFYTACNASSGNTLKLIGRATIRDPMCVLYDSSKVRLALFTGLGMGPGLEASVVRLEGFGLGFRGLGV